MPNQDSLVYYGDAIKVIGEGKIGGYLVRFGSPDSTDLEKDYFSKSTDFDTDFDASPTTSIYYNHGMDPVLKLRKLGNGTMKIDDVGVWIETQLEMRDSYEEAIMDLVKESKLGWSSGTASHLMSRQQVGDAYEITRWPIVEASITPTPAQWNNQAIPVKLLSELMPTAEADDIAGDSEADGEAAMPETGRSPVATVPDESKNLALEIEALEIQFVEQEFIS